MTIEEFLEQYDKEVTNKSIKEIFSEHITTTYVPYLSKVTFVFDTLDFVCGDSEAPGRILLDVVFKIRLLSLYTDLKFEKGVASEQYDYLCQRDIDTLIPEIIGENEYNRFCKILEDSLEDRFKKNIFDLLAK